MSRFKCKKCKKEFTSDEINENTTEIKNISYHDENDTFLDYFFTCPACGFYGKIENSDNSIRAKYMLKNYFTPKSKHSKDCMCRECFEKKGGIRAYMR